MMRWKIELMLLLLPAAVCRAQVISSLEGDASLTKDGSSRIITGITDSDTLQEQFMDWNCILGEFSETTVIKQEQIKQEISELSAEGIQNTRRYGLNGHELDLPSCIDENGIDLYMLTDEGITIYMALLAPAYYQETTDDIIKWVRFYAYQHRERTKRIFDRYEKWEPFIKKCFEERGVPPELAELCIVESGCTYKALSPKGAYGMWQLMPATAREWGLTVSENDDEREDPVKATITAAKILRQSHGMSGDWTLCAAGYNCGMGRVKKITGTYGTQEWLLLKNRFPKETQQYIPSLLAVHYVWNYRKELGF